MTETWDIVIVGSGNAALCAGIAACEHNKRVLIVEKADENMSGGNTKYTAGAMRFAYDHSDDLLPLLANPNDPRVKISDFGSYAASKFSDDLLGFNDGVPLTPEQKTLVQQSYPTMLWLAGHGVTFDPIYARQSFEKDGKLIFWGGLTLAAENEGVGLFEMEMAAYKKLGGEIRFNAAMVRLNHDGQKVTGITLHSGEVITAKATILACGGFESNADMRIEHMGPEWKNAKVRGTPHNTGDGLRAAWNIGAQKYGRYDACHATPMDLHMKDFGNLQIPHSERKNYRKISYFLGIMLNAEGNRFVDEGKDYRNYTYAQFGKSILQQPGQYAWQIFDSKVTDLLYGEYRFFDASFVTANDIPTLLSQCDGIDTTNAEQTLADYNAAIETSVAFDPTTKDGKSTKGLALSKSNWAQKLDTPPFYAYPVTGGVTFTYGGLKISEAGAVINTDGTAIPNLFACGEIVGGVFQGGYPGGSGLTSGAVFGRICGEGAAKSI